MNQDIENYTSPDFKGEPVYTFLFHTNNPDVDHGGICSINIEISGAGDVDSAKLNISMSSYLVDGKVEVKYNSPGRETRSFEEVPPITMGLPLELFTNWTPDGFSPINRGERYFNGLPLISFSFKVPKKAPRGVHKIFFTLTYKGQKSNKWYKDNQIMEIRIKRFYETPMGKFILILAAIIAALPGLPTLWNILDILWSMFQTSLCSL
ncbi:MAG: hypothetical protein PHN90_12185 [Methanothrix sp.]|jgi:hypothetical protein|nr:hypothetical protein [Methanothrix sp.]OPX81644.1 MAG: hypothetical protein A4E50_00854 [Methanosaeta sp. PtaB.Bin087]NLX39629.1 hypothetical protein [Methanothrix sp.]HOI68173.1 hypothetical protein [Methanothrix sp.]HPY72050.1 hypothetical protein [Methanothrix sp.]